MIERMGKTKLNRIVVSCLLVFSLLINTLPTYGADGDTETGGGSGDIGTGVGVAVGTNSSGSISGTKISIIKTPISGENIYDTGLLFNKTPMGMAPGTTQAPTDVKGSTPIYVMYSAVAKYEGITEGNGYVSKHSIANYIVGGASKYGLTPEESAQFSKLQPAMGVNWRGAVGNMMDILGIYPKTSPKYNEEENKNLLKALGKVFKSHYGSVSGEMGLVIDGMVKDGVYLSSTHEYILLVEPIYYVNDSKGIGQYGITVNQMAQSYLAGMGRDVRGYVNLAEVVGDKDRGIMKIPNFKGHRFTDIWDIFTGMMSGLALTSNTRGQGESIASKIHYIGPKEVNPADAKNPIRATKADFKWGWGTIRPKDLGETSDVKQVYYGVVDLDGEGSSTTFKASGKLLEQLETSTGRPGVKDIIDVSSLDKDSLAYQEYLMSLNIEKRESTLLGLAVDRSISTDFQKSILPSVASLDKKPKAISDDEMFNETIIMVANTKPEDGSTDVVIDEFMADMYKEPINSVVSVGYLNLIMGGEYKEFNGALNIMYTKALERTKSMLLSEIRGEPVDPKIINTGQKIVHRRTDDRLVYGEGDIGKFNYYAIDHNALRAFIMINIADISKSNTDYADYFGTGLNTHMSIYGWSYLNAMIANMSEKINYDNTDVENACTLLSMYHEDKQSLSNFLIKSGLYLSDGVTIENTDKITVKKHGNSTIAYAIQTDGVGVDLEFIMRNDDGVYEVVEDNRIKTDLKISADKSSAMLLPDEVLYNGEVVAVTQGVVRSAKNNSGGSRDRYNEELVEDLNNNKKVTSANDGYDVPIFDLTDEKIIDPDMELPRIQLSARQDDLNLDDDERITVMLVVEPTIDTTLVEVTVKHNGDHVKTEVDTIDGDSYEIKDNGDAKVISWFTSDKRPKEINNTTPWEELDRDPYKNSESIQGDGEGLVEFEDLPKPVILYVKYEEPDISNPPLYGGGSKASQYISYQYDFYDLGVDPVDVGTSLTSFGFGAHIWYCGGCLKNGGCPGHGCYDVGWVDPSYTVRLEDTANQDKKVVAPDGGVFKFKYTNNLESGDLYPLPKFEDVNLLAVAHRGYDVVTLAKYKPNQPAWDILGIIDYPVGNTPQGTRSNGGYTKNDKYTLEIVGDKVIVKKECNVGHIHTAEIKANRGIDFALEFLQTRGKENFGIAKAVETKPDSVIMNGKVIKNISGVAVDRGNIDIYPYVEMLYETTSVTNQKVDVLADDLTHIKINDYMEIGWHNTQPENMELESKQWSIHRNATNGSQWRQRGKVLPGGAILGIKTSNNTDVGLTTYQTYIEKAILDSSAGSQYNLGWLNVNSKKQIHLDAVTNFRGQVSQTDLQMMVNKNWQKGILDKDGAVKADRGQSISLDYTRKLNTDNKYGLHPGAVGKNTSSKFNVTPENTKVTHYKVKADVYGTVYLLKGTDGINWSTVKTWGKGVSNDSIISQMKALGAEYKDLDDKTKIMTNFVNGIDRNLGWYNEAWDGICVIKQESVFEMGLLVQPLRQLVLDPRLTPIQQKKSDMFKSAFSFGFKVKDRNIVVPFISGATAKLDNVDIMQVSHKRFIPNVTVMDID